MTAARRAGARSVFGLPGQTKAPHAAKRSSGAFCAGTLAVLGLHMRAQVVHHRLHIVVIVGGAGEVEGVDLRADIGDDDLP